MVTIRPATSEDLGAIRDIYNEAVVNTTATFDTEPKTLEDRVAWFTNRSSDFPVVVAVKEGVVLGYCALNRWSERKAYDITAEISVYIRPESRGMGVGKKLIAHICQVAQQTNLVSILARITEGNEQSIYLHELNGFELIGVLKKSGLKFGKLLNVTLMQKMLK